MSQQRRHGLHLHLRQIRRYLAACSAVCTYAIAICRTSPFLLDISPLWPSLLIARVKLAPLYLSCVRLLSPLLLLHIPSRHCRTDDFHRTVCPRGHRSRHAAEQEPFDPTEPTRPHKERIRLPLLGLVEEHLLWITGCNHPKRPPGPVHTGARPWRRGSRTSIRSHQSRPSPSRSDPAAAERPGPYTSWHRAP